MGSTPGSISPLQNLVGRVPATRLAIPRSMRTCNKIDIISIMLNIIDISDIIWSVMMLRVTPRRVSHKSCCERGQWGGAITRRAGCAEHAVLRCEDRAAW